MPTPMMVLLRGSLALYKTHASLLAGYAAWLLLPYAGLILVQSTGNEQWLMVAVGIFIVIELCLWIWIHILLTFAVDGIVSAQKREISQLHESVRSVIWPVVLVSFLQMLVVLGGTLLLIVPGVIFSVWYYFAPLSAMLDGKRGTEALSFSRELSRGRFWRTAWLILGGPLVISLVYYPIVSLLIILLASLTGTGMDALVSDNLPLWADIIATVGDVFLLPLTATYFVLVYRELRASMKPL